MLNQLKDEMWQTARFDVPTTVKFDVLGCDTMWNYKYIPAFRRNMLPTNPHGVTTQNITTNMWSKVYQCLLFLTYSRVDIYTLQNSRIALDVSR